MAGRNYVDRSATVGDLDMGTIVADVGSQFCRMGFAGDDQPRALFSSAVGVLPKMQGNGFDYHWDIMKFRENMAVECPMNLSDGLVEDWDLWERMMQHGASQYLKADLRDTPILIAEKPYNPPLSRQRTCEYLMERFGSSAVFLARDAALSCYACGKTSGLVADCGVVTAVQDGWVSSVGRGQVGGRLLDEYTAHLLQKAHHLPSLRPLFSVQKAPLDPIGLGAGLGQVAALSAGSSAVRWERVTDRSFAAGAVHPSFSAYHKLEAARELKESVCRVSDSPVSEDRSGRVFSLPAVNYELPDGTLLEVGGDRFLIPELLLDTTPLLHFQAQGAEDSESATGLLQLLRSGHRERSSLPAPPRPAAPLRPFPSSSSSSSSSVPAPRAPAAHRLGLAELVSRVVSGCDAEWQAPLLNGLLVVGGGARCEGLADRLKVQLEQAAEGVWKVKITPPPAGQERALTAWLGGSIVGSLSTLTSACSDMWISKAEYEEFGPNIVDRKCP